MFAGRRRHKKNGLQQEPHIALHACNFRVSSLLCSLVRFTVFLFFARPSVSSWFRYRLVIILFASFPFSVFFLSWLCICLLFFAVPLRFSTFSFTDCRKFRSKVVLLEDFKWVKTATLMGNISEDRRVCCCTSKFSNDKNQNQKLLLRFSCHFLFDTLTVKRWSP